MLVKNEDIIKKNLNEGPSPLLLVSYPLHPLTLPDKISKSLLYDFDEIFV